MNDYEILQQLENANVYVKSFSGARISFMSDYAKPTLRLNPDHTVLYIGTHDLPTKKDLMKLPGILWN